MNIEKEYYKWLEDFDKMNEKMDLRVHLFFIWFLALWSILFILMISKYMGVI